MSVSATMSSASNVYHGPSSTIYASVGSVALNEAVQVFAIEKNWFYIEYKTATASKRGYVPYSSINNAASIANSVPTRNFTGYADVPVQNVTIYMGPGTAFATSGSISAGEGITKFNETSGSYTYIEYSTASKTKRGYVLTSQLASRNRGLLGTVTASSATVYTGPDTLYVQGGGVYRDEYVVILETSIATSPAWFFIEFNSAYGRKRGYVDQATITPNSPLFVDSLGTIEGIATALQVLTVYSGPNQYYASVGSISANEMVSRIDGSPVESSYAFIEYNTTSGKKRGYVTASALGSLPGSYATMLNASNVYHGPDSSNYAQVGSVALNEGVQVLAKENNWFFIEYSTSSGNKRGYVPYNTINNAATIANNVPERIFEGFADVPNINATVYMGPNPTYATSGSISLNEGITKFNETSGNYTYIEYSTSSGTKRGYILTTQLSNRNRGILATVSATSASVYSGPDGVFFHSGGVFQGEYVVILERDISSVYLDRWYYIEFNSASGRKRGYVKQELITPCSDLSSIDSLRTGNGLALALQDLTVYSGPNSSFSTVGSVFTNERVSVLSGVSAESEYSYIEYNTGGSASKRGYVPTNALQSTSVSLPVISVPNVTEGIYGYSGNNRPLKYYKLGNGQNVLAAVFQVHGFEDAWAADGEELNKIAGRLIQDLSVDNLPSWTVYVIPSANPDGLLDGWTNNGQGRTTLSTVNDINRSFPANFNPFYDSRNYTGSTSLASPEALALRDTLLEWKPSTGTMILLDVHGWLNQSLGDYEVGQHFCTQFGFNNSSLDSASGYLTRWGQLNGMLASLIELPFPSSPQDIVTRDFAGKFIQATRNLINAFSPNIVPVTGVTVSPTLVTIDPGQTEQLTATVSPSDATFKFVTWTSNNPSIATVDANGLVTAGTTNGSVTITVTTEDGNFSASVTVNVAPPRFLELLRQLEDVARTSPDVATAGYPIHSAIFDFLRQVRYATTKWDLTVFHPLRWSFVDYVRDNYPSLFNELYTYICEDFIVAQAYGNSIDLAHLDATTQGYSGSPLVPNFWVGWGGDLATAMANVTGLVQAGREEFDAATEVIGNPNYSFALTDMHADMDAIKLSELLVFPDLSIADTMDSYFQSVTATNRRDYILEDMDISSVPTEEFLTNTIYDKINGPEGFNLLIAGQSLLGLATYTVPGTEPPVYIEPTYAVKQATCKAFARFILNL